eukprot:gene1209-biopygen9538
MNPYYEEGLRDRNQTGIEATDLARRSTLREKKKNKVNMKLGGHES